MTAHAASAGAERQHRRDEEQVAARPRRDDDLLEDELEHIGEGLQEPERPYPVGADANLHPADHLALGERQVGNAQDQRHGDDDDLGERPDDGPRGSEQRLDRCGERIERHLQTRSTVMGPDRPPKPQVDGWAAAIRTTPAGTAASSAAVSTASPFPCRTLT